MLSGEGSEAALWRSGQSKRGGWSSVGCEGMIQFCCTMRLEDYSWHEKWVKIECIVCLENCGKSCVAGMGVRVSTESDRKWLWNNRQALVLSHLGSFAKDPGSDVVGHACSACSDPAIEGIQVEETWPALCETLSKRVFGVGQLGEWAVTDAEEWSRNQEVRWANNEALLQNISFFKIMMAICLM